MATRYWVGGSGNWSETSHWSTTSGGSGGASVPIFLDDVIFDSNSLTEAATVYIGNNSLSSYSVSGNSFDFSDIDQDLIIRATSTSGSFGTRMYFDLYGDFTGSPLLSIYNYGSLQFFPYRSLTFNQNGMSIPYTSQFGMMYNFTQNIVISLGSDCTLNTIQLNGATFITNGYDVDTCSLIIDGTFNYSNSTVTVTYGISSAQTVIFEPTSTIISTNGTLIYRATSRTLNGGGKTIERLVLDPHQSWEQGVIVSNINATELSLNGIDVFSSNVTARKVTAKDATIRSNTSGTQRTLNIIGSNQLIAGDNLSVKDNLVTGSGQYYATTNSGNASGWTFSEAPTATSLQDNFPGSSVDTSKWATSTSSGGTISQTSGALIVAGSNSSSFSTIRSIKQYVLEDSELRAGFNLTGFSPNSGYTFSIASASSQYGISPTRNIPNISIQVYYTGTQYNAEFVVQARTSWTYTVENVDPALYWRVRENNGSIFFGSSTNGLTFSDIIGVVAANVGLDTTQLLARPGVVSSGSMLLQVTDFNIDLTPTAGFSASPVIGNTPLSVSFTDTSNFSPTSWEWDFGDGSTSTLQNPTHLYDEAGTYTVSLEASNGTDTETSVQTNYITVEPNVLSRTISGTILWTGGVDRTVKLNREMSGTILWTGGVNSFVRKDTNALEEKRYLYKIYDENGNYIETWRDVIDEPQFSQEINQLGSTMTVQLARNADSLGQTTSPLQTEDGQTILTEDGQTILATTTSRNQVGPGSSVQHNYRVDVYVFYGEVAPLLTESGEEILTEDGETILAVTGAPNGRRIFTGFISDINIRYGDTETTTVTLSSYGFDTNQYVVTDGDGKTTVTYNSWTPSDIAEDLVDKFVAQSSGESYLTYTHRDATSISSTVAPVSYTFQNNTYGEALQKVLELMPSDWYFYVGLGDNLVYFRQRSETPRHVFYLGKHIKSLDLRSYTADSVNSVYFTGGGDPALFKRYEAPTPEGVRRGLNQYSDSRVTLESSADIISEGLIDEKNKVQYRSTIDILTKQYDIESINVGDTIGFRNFGNYVDTLVLQVVARTYTPDVVTLQLDSMTPSVNKRLEDIRRALAVTDNQNVPDQPTI